MGASYPAGDIARIADDLDSITRADFVFWFTRHDSASVEEVESEAEVVDFHLDRARRFVRGLAKSGRGFTYMIG